MNNSAWYSRLWRRKLENLPVKIDADQAWTGMRQQLDYHMPLDKTSGNDNTKIPKSAISKIVSLLTYVLPAAAMVCTITYLSVRHKENHKSYDKKPEHKKSMPVYRHDSDSNHAALSDTADTLDSLQNDDTLTNILIKSKGTLTSVLLLERKKTPDKVESPNGGLKKADSIDTNPRLTRKNNKGIVIAAAEDRAQAGKSNFELFTQVDGNYHQKNTSNSNYRVKKSGAMNKKSMKFQNKPYTAQITKESSIDTGNSTVQIDKVGDANQIASKTAFKDTLGTTNDRHAVSQPYSVEGRSKLADAEYAKEVNKAKQPKQPRSKNNKKDNRPVGFLSDLFGNGKARRSSLDYGKGFSYGLKAGYAGNNIDPNFYVGGYTSFDVNEHWYFSPSVILNSARTISGSYLHDSYFRPDSIPPFTIVDSRKIYFLDLNLNMGYRLSKPISINVGPVISTSFKQTAIDSKVGYVPDMRDTIMHKQAINASLAKTTLSPKLNIGVAGGINIQFRRFNVEGSYQYNLMPYVIKSDLGNYKLNYHSFKIGIGFQFNKSR